MTYIKTMFRAATSPAAIKSMGKAAANAVTTGINQAMGDFKTSTEAAKESAVEQGKDALAQVGSMVSALPGQVAGVWKKELPAIGESVKSLGRDIKTFLANKFPRLKKAIDSFLQKHEILGGIFKGLAPIVKKLAPAALGALALSFAISQPIAAAVVVCVGTFLLPHIKSLIGKICDKIREKIQAKPQPLTQQNDPQAPENKTTQPQITGNRGPEAPPKNSETQESSKTETQTHEQSPEVKKDTPAGTLPEAKDAANTKSEAGEAAKPKDPENPEKKESTPTASAEKNPTDVAESKKLNTDDKTPA